MRGLNPVDVHVGQALARLRAERNLTTVEMAALAGVDEATLAEMEAGTHRAPARMLIALCAHLNVPMAYFYDGMTPGTKPRTLMSLI